MHGHDFGSAALPWQPMEETVLMLSREQEWAEAYADEHPDCPLGRIYLDYLRRELVQALAEL
jgi:hypothetical protein